MDADLQIRVWKGGTRFHVTLRHAGRFIERRLSSDAGQRLLLGAGDGGCDQGRCEHRVRRAVQAEHVWQWQLRTWDQAGSLRRIRESHSRQPQHAKAEHSRPKENSPARRRKAKPSGNGPRQSGSAKPADRHCVTGKPARFVRIELPGDKRILTLAEVEVFSGGRNIAAGGKATQSSTHGGGVASKGIDGNKDPDWGKQGQTHTSNAGAKESVVGTRPRSSGGHRKDRHLESQRIRKSIGWFHHHAAGCGPQRSLSREGHRRSRGDGDRRQERRQAELSRLQRKAGQARSTWRKPRNAEIRSQPRNPRWPTCRPIIATRCRLHSRRETWSPFSATAWRIGCSTTAGWRRCCKANSSTSRFVSAT